MVEWRYSSTILDVDSRCRLVINFMPLTLYSREKEAPSAHWIGSWVGFKASLRAVEYRKISFSTGN
jgi:hypothetical protein